MAPFLGPLLFSRGRGREVIEITSKFEADDDAFIIGGQATTRDDLSQPLCSGPRGAEERATGLSALEADDPSITAGGPQWPKTGANQGSRLDPCATGSG